MRSNFRKFSPTLSAAVAATLTAFAGKTALAQNYQVTNSFTATASNPYTAVDPWNANPGTTVTYTSIANIADPTTPAGGAPGSVFIGDVYNSSAGVGSAFAYTATSGVQLIGAYTETSTGTRSTTPSVSGTNAYGQVVGYQSQNSADATGTGVLGYESWLATPNSSGGYTSVFLSGLTGTYNGYSKSVDTFGDTGTYSYTQAKQIASNGDVAGITLRYEGNTAASPSTSLGTSAWVFTPSTVNSNAGSTSSSNYTEIGLMGSGNSYNLTFSNASSGTNTQPYYSNSISAISATSVAGYANEYSGFSNNQLYSSGTDAWVYNGGVTTPVGGFYLNGTNSSVTGTVVVSATNHGNNLSFTVPSPTVVPTSGTFSSNLSYGFITTSATYNLGSTALTAVDRNSGIAVINDLGQVGLTTTYYVGNSATSSGQDGFIYTPSSSSPGTGTYTQVGLTADSLSANNYSNSVLSFVSYNGRRSTSIAFLNASGQSAGTSNTYIGNNATGSGQAAWTANASGGTTQIGLYNTVDGIHVSNGGNSAVSPIIAWDYVTGMNSKGLVAGYTYRGVTQFGSSSLGQDAWVYDPSNIDPLTGTNTWIVDPADEATANYTSSQIYYLSPTGIAVGRYATSSTTSSSYIYNAFIWSESGGWDPLTNVDVSGLSAAGYQAVINAYYTDLGGDTIVGTGTFTQASSASANGLVTLSQVPEPASLSLVGLGATGLLRRRRRSAMAGA